MTFAFEGSQVLLFALQKKGVISESELERYDRHLANMFRLKNILSTSELRDVRGVLRKLEIPDPRHARGTTDMAYMIAIGDAKLKALTPTGGDRIYSYPDELEGLLMALDYAGFRNKKTIKNLEESLELARRYDP